ncbi:MAG: BON domain-containing protein [Phycisphaerae bacterium]|jgi:osmotically-inducible protein OsmY
MSGILSSNEKLKEKILDQLFWDSRLNAANVQVDVIDKNVVLNGTIPSHKARLAAEADAYSVPGVLQVQNNLKIAYSQNHSKHNDDEILKGIVCILMWNPDIDSSKIIVEVKDGTVLLQGCVGSFWQKKLAKELALDTAGVMDVADNIIVKPSDNIIDESVADAIIAALERSTFVDAQTVGVKVENGIVTLFGTVCNFTALNETITLAAKIVGIVDVINDLKIEPDSSRIYRRP